MQAYYVIYKLFNSGMVFVASAKNPEEATLVAGVPPGTVASVFPVDDCTEVRVAKTATALTKD